MTATQQLVTSLPSLENKSIFLLFPALRHKELLSGLEARYIFRLFMAKPAESSSVDIAFRVMIVRMSRS